MGVLRGRLTAGVHWALTTRNGVQSAPPWQGFNVASHCGDDAGRVQANRQWLLRALDVEGIVWLDQVHGNGCVSVDAVPSTPPSADAAGTTRRRLALAIMVADCLPVLLADRGGRWVGAAHCGWRGLAAGVLDTALAAAPVPASELIAWLGPRICSHHYEVDAPVRDALAAHDQAFRSAGRGRWQLDLGAVARAQLSAAGVCNVHDRGGCAFVDRHLYSYRRDRVTGRNAALVWLA